MKHKLSAGLGVTALAAGALVAVAQPASAAISELTLSLPMLSGLARQSVTLTCLPTGGTHPDAEAACADLMKAAGDISRIPPMTGVGCPGVYIPVQATATGHWGPRAVSYSQTFSNACVANVATGGHVFNFSSTK